MSIKRTSPFQPQRVACNGSPAAAAPSSRGTSTAGSTSPTRTTSPASAQSREIEEQINRILCHVVSSSSGKENKFGHFVVGVQLIHRLMQADINCTTIACLFFFPLLGYRIGMTVTLSNWSHNPISLEGLVTG